MSFPAIVLGTKTLPALAVILSDGPEFAALNVTHWSNLVVVTTCVHSHSKQALAAC